MSRPIYPPGMEPVEGMPDMATKNLSLGNPADWPEIVSSGAVWSCAPEWQDKAMTDIVDGTLPMPENVPEEIRVQLEQEMAK